jgi:hypothetical protein
LIHTGSSKRRMTVADIVRAARKENPREAGHRG